MRCQMNRFLNLATLAVLLWFGTAFLPWVKVLDPHSDTLPQLGNLVGAELTALSLLVPAITLLIVVISRYQKLARVLVPVASLIAAAGTGLVYFTDLASYVAVSDLIANTTGQGSTAGFQLEPQIGSLAFTVAGALSVVLLVVAAFQKNVHTKGGASKSVTESSTQDLWDLQ